ncbi:MAG: hypothetical protein WCQ21_30985 [Verrucomicrobiota bacterium]
MKTQSNPKAHGRLFQAHLHTKAMSQNRKKVDRLDMDSIEEDGVLKVRLTLQANSREEVLKSIAGICAEAKLRCQLAVLLVHDGQNWQDVTAMQSQSNLSTELEWVAALLRVKPTKPVKTFNQFITRLGIQTTSRNYSGMRVCHFLRAHLKSVIDHYVELTLKNGDVLIMVQPYDRPTQAHVDWVEKLGGALFSPHAEWGFNHILCDPYVFLVPAQAVQNFA